MTTLKTTIFFHLLTTFVFGQNQSFDTTLVINKMTIQIKTKAINNDLLLLTSTCGAQTTLIDTIESRGLAYIKYPDFNKDGNPDILMDFFGNNSTYSLYLFDPTKRKFIEIENYASFPDAIHLKTNPKYYYSYHRAGCADMNWVSDLFTIQDFKIIQLGHIDGQGCNFEVKENPQLLKIYKVTNNDEENEKLIEELPYLKLIPEYGDKWYFIENYWNNNYAKFK